MAWPGVAVREISRVGGTGPVGRGRVFSSGPRNKNIGGTSSSSYSNCSQNEKLDPLSARPTLSPPPFLPPPSTSILNTPKPISHPRFLTLSNPLYVVPQPTEQRVHDLQEQKKYHFRWNVCLKRLTLPPMVVCGLTYLSLSFFFPSDESRYPTMTFLFLFLFSHPALYRS